MKPLDPYCLDLEQTVLIEASAGTGKTYTITTLVVRLIAQGFPVESILVVTFTEAAAAELKLRIRQRLSHALRNLENPDPGKDNFQGDDLAEFLYGLADPGLVQNRIRLALTCFDQASIMTIHSFCFQSLREHAFESGAYFDMELVPESSVFLDQVCMDFFMARINDLDPLILRFLAKKGFTPEKFVTDFRQAVSHQDCRPIPEHAQFMDVPGSWRDTAGKIWECLRKGKDQIIGLMASDKGLNKRSYSRKNVPTWLGTSLEKFETQGRDAFFVMEEKGDPLFRFAASRIALATKPGFSPLEHEFFDLCEDLLMLYRDMAMNLICLRLDFLSFFSLELEKIKAAQGICFFDDLVNDLACALEGRDGQKLARAVRQKYRACLIDEFQDTDPRQYGIFSTLFSGPGKSPFFMIGDPKQAIYAFRGGDIFAYLAASRDCDQVFTLDHNYRSSPLLVQGINHIFSLRPHPFLFREIEFTPVSSPDTAFDRLLRDGKPARPLRFSLVSRDGSALDRKGFMKKEQALRAIPPVLASQIMADLGSGFRLKDGQGGQRALAPGDMAVLVRTNRQAESVHKALSRLKIPSVISKTGSVFDSGEAVEFYTILLAAANPWHQGGVKAALVTSVFGLRARDLLALDRDDTALARWQERFRSFRDIWETRGIAAMFMGVFHSGYGVLNPDSRINERGLTNFYHLLELASQDEQRRHLSINFLLKWLEKQLAPKTRDQSADELRLESDKQAVAIVTVHKSKGLEYPVVYLPYLWADQGTSQAGGPILFHDPQNDNRLRLDLRPGLGAGMNQGQEPGVEQSAMLKSQEDLAEQRRLLYVALTRASAMCRVLWGGFSGVEASALGQILHPKGCGSDEDMRLDLVGAMGETTALETPETSAGTCPVTETAFEEVLLEPRFLGRSLAPVWRMSSFSGIVSSKRPVSPEPGPGRARQDIFAPTSRAGAKGPRDGDLPIVLKAFPKGANAGDFFHAVLEQLDFRNPGDIHACVRANLSRFGFHDSGLALSAEQAIRHVLAARLESDIAGFCLEDIALEDRFSELEFVFDVKDFNLSALVRSLNDQGRFPGYPDLLAGLLGQSFKGFIKGFIDLVVRYQDKWYILDYKSNFLGDTYPDYDGPAMESAMLDHHYILQYHIYLSALDRYLGLRLKDYDYSRDMGGVFYLFIRGMHPKRANSGIFFDRPPRDMLNFIQGSPSGFGKHP